MKLLQIRKYFLSIKYSIISYFARIRHFLISMVTERYWLLDWIPARTDKTQSVAIIRLDVIGDFVLWLDSAKELRKIYPNKKIVLFANSSWAELAKRLSHWDEVVSVDMSKFRINETYRLKMLYLIHRLGFDVAIHPTYSREYLSDMLLRASGALERIGFDGDLSNISIIQKQISDAWYTKLIKSDCKKEMELIRNAEFIRNLGLSNFKSEVQKIPKLIDLPKSLKISNPYIIIFPGASWSPKLWPAKNFAQLVKILKLKYKLQVVFCGSDNEYILCKQIIELSGVDEAINFAGKTSLIELVEVIRNSEFLFANDTSAIHIAASTNTLAICILGGGHYGRFLPYQSEVEGKHRNPKVCTYLMDCFNCNWNCKFLNKNQQTVPCIENVTVDSVLAQYIALTDS